MTKYKYEILGSEIKKHRKIMRYTQKDVAEFLGIPPSSYASYELGKRLLPLEYIVKLINHLQIDSQIFKDHHPKMHSLNFESSYDDDFKDDETFHHYSFSNTELVLALTSIMNYNDIKTSVPDNAEYMNISTEDIKVSLDYKELNTLNKRIAGFIEYELYRINKEKTIVIKVD